MSKSLGILTALIIISVCLFAASTPAEKQPSAEQQKLTAQVAKIFEQSCATSGCHKGQFPKKKLNLEADKFAAAMVDVKSLQIDSLKMVDTKAPEKSYLLMKIRGDKGIIESRMPIDATPLKEAEIKAIEAWMKSLKVDEKEKK
jgi:mono/diheme cytochrome c family protein